MEYTVMIMPEWRGTWNRIYVTYYNNKSHWYIGLKIHTRQTRHAESE